MKTTSKALGMHYNSYLTNFDNEKILIAILP